ncbi:MAG: hypothetical protein AB7E95_04990 [Kiritimatiellales bacterium]
MTDLLEQAVALSQCGNNGISFDMLAEQWLKVAETAMTPSTRLRAAGVIRSLNCFLKTTEARRITKLMLEEWAEMRSKEISARTFYCERKRCAEPWTMPFAKASFSTTLRWSFPN